MSKDMKKETLIKRGHHKNKMLLFQGTAEKRALCEQSSFENTSSGRWHTGYVGRRWSLVSWSGAKCFTSVSGRHQLLKVTLSRS